MAEQVTATKARWNGRHWARLAFVWVAISLPFILLCLTSRRVVLNEIRNHARGVAIAIASAIDPAQVEQVRGPEDVNGEAFKRLSALLARIRDPNPDVQFVYIMRRSQTPLSPPSALEFVVDSPARDRNQNGKIDPDEASELPGKSYDASNLPQMQAGWSGPSADLEITPDPPYPDLISGYAPIVGPDGKTVAMAGVDVLAQTVRAKMIALRIVMFVVWLVIGLLVTLIMHLYYQQQEALESIRRLNAELESRNELLREANETMARDNERYERELKLAQSVQEGFLPKAFPREDRILFDKYYLTCAILGGDLFDAFDIDEDHVGLFMADVAGHGVSAALISGLLKMAISSVREQSATATSTLYADLTNPGAVVRMLNELLVKEMPENEFITLVYAVVNLTENRVEFANAGHPWPVRFSLARKAHEVCRGRSGMAMGLQSGEAYPVNTIAVAEGDKVIFYTDGLTEAMNAEGEEFGEDRFLRIVDQFGGQTPAELIAAVREAVEAHRGPHEVSDDFSMLVAEIR